MEEQKKQIDSVMYELRDHICIAKQRLDAAIKILVSLGLPAFDRKERFPSEF